jgi:magnesium chelatase family protein
VSADVAVRIAAARWLQRSRYENHGVRTNAEADGELLDSVATPDAAGVRLLTDAADAMRLTARGYRVLRVARTIADLVAVERVGRMHIAEALAYRRAVHAG